MRAAAVRCAATSIQSIGPLDSKNDPLGGRSLVEVNAEARIKIIGPFGVVPFIDGGQVYDEVYPRALER